MSFSQSQDDDAITPFFENKKKNTSVFEINSFDASQNAFDMFNEPQESQKEDDDSDAHSYIDELDMFKNDEDPIENDRIQEIAQGLSKFEALKNQCNQLIEPRSKIHKFEFKNQGNEKIIPQKMTFMFPIEKREKKIQAELLKTTIDRRYQEDKVQILKEEKPKFKINFQKRGEQQKQIEQPKKAQEQRISINPEVKQRQKTANNIEIKQPIKSQAAIEPQKPKTFNFAFNLRKSRVKEDIVEPKPKQNGVVIEKIAEKNALKLRIQPQPKKLFTMNITNSLSQIQSPFEMRQIQKNQSKQLQGVQMDIQQSTKAHQSSTFQLIGLKQQLAQRQNNVEKKGELKKVSRLPLQFKSRFLEKTGQSKESEDKSVQRPKTPTEIAPPPQIQKPLPQNRMNGTPMDIQKTRPSITITPKIIKRQQISLNNLNPESFHREKKSELEKYLKEIEQIASLQEQARLKINKIRSSFRQSNIYLSIANNRANAKLNQK